MEISQIGQIELLDEIKQELKNLLGTVECFDYDVVVSKGWSINCWWEWINNDDLSKQLVEAVKKNGTNKLYIAVTTDDFLSKKSVEKLLTFHIETKEEFLDSLLIDTDYLRFNSCLIFDESLSFLIIKNSLSRYLYAGTLEFLENAKSVATPFGFEPIYSLPEKYDVDLIYDSLDQRGYEWEKTNGDWEEYYRKWSKENENKIYSEDKTIEIMLCCDVISFAITKQKMKNAMRNIDLVKEGCLIETQYNTSRTEDVYYFKNFSIDDGYMYNTSQIYLDKNLVEEDLKSRWLEEGEKVIKYEYKKKEKSFLIKVYRETEDKIEVFNISSERTFTHVDLTGYPCSAFNLIINKKRVLDNDIKMMLDSYYDTCEKLKINFENEFEEQY